MESQEPEAVTLKNGATEFKPLVAATMLSLGKLLQDNPIAFYELTMKARDSKHEFFGNVGSELKLLALIQENGNLHDSIRNIVLSVVEGEGAMMRLTSAT